MNSFVLFFKKIISWNGVCQGKKITKYSGHSSDICTCVNFDNVFFHKLASHFGCCRWNQLNEFRSSQRLSSLSTLFRESQLLLTQYGSNKWFCFSLFTPRKEQVSGRWHEIIRTDIFRLWGAIDWTLTSVLWLLLCLLQAGWALVWLDTGSRPIDQCWSQTCVLAKISQGALRKCMFLGLAIMLRKPQISRCDFHEPMFLKAPWGLPTRTVVGNW